MKRDLIPRRLSHVLGAGMVAVSVLLLSRGFAADKAPSKRQPANVAQAIQPNAIPNAKNNAVQQAPANGLNLPDVGKGVIESPTKRILAQTVPGPASPASEFVNPKVEPGKVRWHKAFADACTAAKKSGKPVLLLQMMGKLDERFC